ncbi:beta strand repeat-containing protein [Ectothiorhodospira variabilis]|uniref:beta strand repeat-containing protein n=1 Tax=Ectothiorhodospira variabilis TaxID=505694 RepID=UPI001EFC2A55|nr:hypothetical protein [Ectothiorhodospira variabilis]MCG5495689.1 hypothetical protein [Ectothiorhodospira variabilis]MCG5504585.1 hypothetical protein [Ectothiorhodospira variabilis]MCG5507707.1 hypothetical protein [Ectothiorhodospira variabilis]
MSARPEDYGTKQQVMEIYAGVWGAAPDFQGVNHWTADIDERGGTLVDLATAFFEAPLVQEKYDGLEGDDLITALYNNIFRVAEPDAEGFAYWQGQVEEDPSLLGDNIGTLIMQMIDGMWDNEEAAETQALYTNFVSAGEKFVAAQEAAGSKAFSDMTAEEQADFLAGAQALAAAVTSESTEEDLDAAVVVAMESVVPAPAPAEPLTLAEALGMEELPDGYEIDAEAEAFDAGDVTVAAALEAFTNVTAILEGAANAEELDASELFVWSVVDDADAIIAAIEEAAVTGAASVSLTNETITQAQADALNALENFELGDVIVTVPGETIMLTAGIDVVGPEVEDEEFRTTADDDTIEGVVSTLAGQGTLNQGDQIDGGEGNDTLKVAMFNSFNGFTGDGFLTNVENVELTNETNNARTFTANGVDGVERYVLNAENAAINLANLAKAGVRVELNDQASGDVGIGFATDAVAGTSDALTLAVANVGTEDADGDHEYVNVTSAGIEQLSVEAAEGDNFVNLSGVAAARDIAVSGAGNLDIEEVGAAVRTFDASEATGNVVADLTDTGVTLTKVVGGAGDDQITVDVSDLALTATIDGGEGDDTLVLEGSGSFAGTMSGFQTLAFANDGTLNISGANVSDVETLRALEGNNQDINISNLSAADRTIEFEGAQTSSAFNYNSAGELTFNVLADADSIADEDQVTNVRDLTANNATALNMAVGEFAKYDGTVTANSATTISIDATGEESELNATLNTTAAAAITLNTGEEDSALAINADNAQSLNVEAGGDLTITGSMDALQTLTVNTDGHFVVSAVDLEGIRNITLEGSEEDSAVTLDALGSATLDGSITLTASGLEGGLSITSIDSDGENVTVTLTEMEGDVDLGTIGATPVGAVNITANGVTEGHFQVGAIDTDGRNVTISASNVEGDETDAVTIGNIGANTAARDVSITLEDITEGVVEIGTIDTDGRAVTLNFASIAGVLTVDDIGGGEEVGDVTITGENLEGAVDVGSIETVKNKTVDLSFTLVDDALTIDDVTVAADGSDATGAINLTVSSLITGDVDVGTLTAKDVMVDLSGADFVGAAALADPIEIAADSVTFTGNAAIDNDATITAKDVTYVGGGEDDTLTIDVADDGDVADWSIDLKGSGTVVIGDGTDATELEKGVVTIEGLAAQDSLSFSDDGVEFALVDRIEDGDGDLISSFSNIESVLDALAELGGHSDGEDAQETDNMAFVFQGDTYLFTSTDADEYVADKDLLIKLVGIEGVVDDYIIAAS